MSKEKKTQAPQPPGWILSTYFAEGFPLGLVRMLSTVYFKDHGAGLQAVGLTSLFGLPWTIKFLWAPIADSFSTKRRWLLLMEALLFGGTLLLAFADVMPAPLESAALIFLVLAFISASHDIAIDAFYLEHLDRTDQARWVGYQAGSYRIALIAAAGGVAFIAGHFSSWRIGLISAAAMLGALWLFHHGFLPKTEKPKRPMKELAHWVGRRKNLLLFLTMEIIILILVKIAYLPFLKPARNILGRISGPNWIIIGLFLTLLVLTGYAPSLKQRLYHSSSPYALAFIDYLDQDRIRVILGFIVSFRIGEALLQNMAYPFLSNIGVSTEFYGLAHNTCGIIASILGGLAGGKAIARFGLKRCVWPFVLSLNSLNLLYMLMAWKYQGILAGTAQGSASYILVIILLSIESFGSGLGTAVFMVFIMRTTRSEFKASHMAIATGLMNLAGTLAGVFSGYLAARLGFVVYFGMTFVATIPNMVLIPFLPYLDRGRAT